MRRAVSVIVATLGALALLASFHTTLGVAGKPLASSLRAKQPPSGASPPTSSVPGTTVPSPSGSGGPNPSTTTPSTATTASRVIDGPVASNFYGDVQVEIKVAGGRLVDVRAIQLPQDRRTSAQISSIAGPMLEQEALQAGSAQIDIVSGATYTSDSFAQSLQAALNRAGI